MNLKNRKTHRSAYFESGVGKDSLATPPQLAPMSSDMCAATTYLL